MFSITRSPSVAVVSEIAPIWMTASSFRLSSHGMSSARWNYIRDLMLGEIAPFRIVATQNVAHHDISRASLIEAGHYVRSDKSGPAGYQKHIPLATTRVRGKPLP